MKAGQLVEILRQFDPEAQVEIKVNIYNRVHGPRVKVASYATSQWWYNPDAGLVTLPAVFCDENDSQYVTTSIRKKV
ncbi:hypothetical protein KDA14_04755 [Candidatus Saccharibacteria bacterium]|nr:hypothetical protein [Candidatus Saccharibacteria bacterium]